MPKILGYLNLVEAKIMQKKLALPVIVAAVCVATVFVFIMQGGGGSPSVVQRSEVKVDTDDGGVIVLTDLLPDLKAGFINGGNELNIIGVMKAGNTTITSRALYRFDISNWKKGDITFNVHCIKKEGNPEKLEVYCINDFGSLPKSPGEEPTDVSDLWNLIGTGVRVGSVSPSENQWFKVVIKESVIQDMKTSDGYLALLLKTSNEDAEPGNVYIISTYEYAVSHNENKPNLTW